MVQLSLTVKKIAIAKFFASHRNSNTLRRKKVYDLPLFSGIADSMILYRVM
jgi:hypothetical protein